MIHIGCSSRCIPGSFIGRAQCLGVKDKKDGHGILLFYATPLTDLCRSFHAPQQLSVDSAGKLVNFNVIDIQRLISQEQNKRYLVDENAGVKGKDSSHNGEPPAERASYKSRNTERLTWL